MWLSGHAFLAFLRLMRLDTCNRRRHVACLRNSMPVDKRDVVTVCRAAAETGRLVLEGRSGILGLTTRQMPGNGKGAPSTASGITPGISQGNAMTMDTAQLDLVNSALQSTNEASRHEASSK